MDRNENVDAAGASFEFRVLLPGYRSRGFLAILFAFDRDHFQSGRAGFPQLLPVAQRQDRGRVRQPVKERVPGQHEPRDSNADERHFRNDRTRSGSSGEFRAAGLSSDGKGIGGCPDGDTE